MDVARSRYGPVACAAALLETAHPPQVRRPAFHQIGPGLKMPKFLRVGVHQKNVSGYTSKAWCIRRVGTTVELKWGAVEVQGVGERRKVSWTMSPREKTLRCGTVQRANAYIK